MTCEKAFIQRLRESGLRLTPQREAILSVLHDIEGLATVDDIFARAHRISSSVDISTVYRTLDLLQEMNLVACVDLGHDQRRYELLGLHGPHLHLVCQACGQVIGVAPGVAQGLRKRLQAEFGFQAALDHVSIPGLCDACASARDA